MKNVVRWTALGIAVVFGVLPLALSAFVDTNTTVQWYAQVFSAILVGGGTFGGSFLNFSNLSLPKFGGQVVNKVDNTQDDHLNDYKFLLKLAKTFVTSKDEEGYKTVEALQVKLFKMQNPFEVK